jgi:magnesium chelatase subunit D
MPFDPAPMDTPPDFCAAVWAVSLLAIDSGLNGAVIRARYGPARDSLIRHFQNLLSLPSRFKKMPPNIADDRLLGGVDLAATLSAGKLVSTRGLLAEAAGGVLVLTMAERLPATTAARLATAIDDGGNFTVLALDEGVEDEAPPAALLDRLAFTVPENLLPPEAEFWPSPAQILAAKNRLATVANDDAAVERLCTIAAMLDVASPRAVLFALRAARAIAALSGRRSVSEADINLAVSLVLIPRAQRIPSGDSSSEEDSSGADEAPVPEPETQANDPAGEPNTTQDDQLTTTPETARAILPAALLDALASGALPRRAARGGGQAGRAPGLTRGRPAGVRPGRIGNGARLSIIETLRAAVPWQTLRHAKDRIAIRADDFRILRFKERARTIAIFAVDASGSAALNRLAEAKGAVQLLLADCYVRRDQVAVLAFRARAAELLLPPTHALARARRCLASLPGGGPTPLATGSDAARALADAERRKGLVLLTDGGANIGRDGAAGRAAAAADALNAARACRAAGIAALVVDTAPRPQAFVARLATEMGARYLPLPYADAAALSRAVQQQEAQNVRLAA